jgi:mono/diheme cytochrome c family protein
MPQFNPLSEDELRALIAYLQSLGGKMADARVARLNEWQTALRAAYARGTDANFAYLHTLVPPQWATLPNPYPADAGAMARGRFVYNQMCVGCHGNFGDGNGPAAHWMDPPPANFTTLRRIGASGGLLYYQIMNGITGSAMMSFKRELESEDLGCVQLHGGQLHRSERWQHRPPRHRRGAGTGGSQGSQTAGAGEHHAPAGHLAYPAAISRRGPHRAGPPSRRQYSPAGKPSKAHPARNGRDRHGRHHARTNRALRSIGE